MEHVCLHNYNEHIGMLIAFFKNKDFMMTYGQFTLFGDEMKNHAMNEFLSPTRLIEEHYV